MSDLSYNPGFYGLETVGEVDYSSGSYEFDTLTVWRRKRTGELLYAEDTGCSCPTPYDGHRLDDGDDPRESLVPATKHVIAARIQARLAERDEWTQYEHSEAEALALIERLMQS